MPKLRLTVENKAAIVEAAESVFAARGFEGTSVKEIAKLAGVSHGLLYHHFTSKQALWQAVSEKAFSHFVAEAVKHQKAYQHLEPWPRLEKMLRFGLEYALRNPKRLRLQAWQSLELVPRFVDDPTSTLLAADLKKLQASGQVRPDLPAEDLARYIALACRGWCAAQVEQRKQKKLRPFDEQWLAMVLTPLRV